jgi:Mg2+ and Co2+ transporter CorA
MNVRLPFERNPYAFWVMLGVMGSIFLVLISYFRHRDWL